MEWSESRLQIQAALAAQSSRKLKMTINADLPDGAPDQVLRTVSENAYTLKFKNFGFEED